MSRELTQSDLDAISAFLDGELDSDQAEDVSRRIRQDSAWRQASEDFSALDTALDAWKRPAADPSLAARIITGVRQASQPRPRVLRLVVAGGSLAAAAAILLAVLVWTDTFKTPSSGPVAQQPAVLTGSAGVVNAALQGIPTRDRLAVENLDFFQDYDVVANLETLQALEKLEQPQSGT